METNQISTNWIKIESRENIKMKLNKYDDIAILEETIIKDNVHSP